MRTPDLQAQSIGRSQLGLVTRRQLTEAGIDHRVVRRRLRAGVWQEPYPTVIDLGTHRVTWERTVYALVLAAGDGACASHRTAAFLHGMLDVARPARIDVTVPRGSSTTVGRVNLHTTLRLDPDERTVVDGVPVTSRLRTVLDLALSVDEEHLELLIGDEVRGRPGAAALLARIAERRPGWPGRRRVLGALHRMLATMDRAESPLEVRGLSLLQRSDLPAPEAQGVVRDEQGDFLGRGDAVWRDARLIVEFMGRRYHDTPSRKAADADRRDRLRAAGWEVVEAHREDLEGARAEALLSRLRARLQPTMSPEASVGGRAG